MTRWTFHSAGSLVFGRGAVGRLGEAAGRLGAKRAFVVTDPTLVKLGLADAVTGPLAAAGLAVELFPGGEPEPSDAAVLRAAEAGRAVRPDVVVGVGGGSNLDVAKLTALLLAHGGRPHDYAGEDRVPGPVVPLVCVPTTAGTGSEVSPAAVFTDTAGHIKLSCLSRHLRPAVALVDPALTDGCPKQVTADSGIDALTHAIEAFTAVDNDEYHRRPGGFGVYQGKNPVADAFAVECVGLVGRFLRRAVADGTDREARDGMALAATLGGLAFSNAGVALTHALEYPVGGAVHVSHGAGNGLLLPYVMRYNLPGRETEFAHLAAILGVGPAGYDTAQGLAEAGIAEVEKLRADIGIPLRLRDVGVTEAMLPGLADKAFAIKRLMRVNPRLPASAADLLDLYRAAL